MQTTGLLGVHKNVHYCILVYIFVLAEVIQKRNV